MRDERIRTVSHSEAKRIGRSIASWLNTFPGKKPGTIMYDWLEHDVSCMAVVPVSGGRITAQYISGGHKAEYQFDVIYRLQALQSSDARLKADETLEELADWAAENPPNLGDGISTLRCEASGHPSGFAIYENGDEDRQISFVLEYEIL